MKLHEGDSYKVLRRMIERGEMVDSVVTDPPYGLVSVVKRFGGRNAAPAKRGRDGLFQRQSKGFMGQGWDGTGVERDPEFWRLVYQVMKPGAYIVAFSSSRTYGHMQVALEQAGFITHPMIGWVFGSGFPKAQNAARAIDQALGVEGTKVATGNAVRRVGAGADQNKDGSWEKLEDREYQPGNYVPATEEAAEWIGWAYGGQARKPALEPIYVGQKPFSEKNGGLNILKHRVGAVNIDGCRVPTDENLNGGAYTKVGKRGSLAGDDRDAKGQGMFRAGKTAESDFIQPLGRWPANLIHDGSAEVEALFPHTKSGKPGVMRKGVNDGACYGAESRQPGTPMSGFGDEGSAARFFEAYTYRCFECRDAGWIPEENDLNDWIQVSCPSCAGSCNDPLPFGGVPILYNAKANKSDRAGSGHPTVKPIALLRSLVRHVTPKGGIVLDPFAGSGTTGQAAREEGLEAILIEADATYAADIRRRLKLPVPRLPADLLELLEGPKKRSALDLSDIL
jgi:site-specific DNA-methyltransferase (adenine-specific)